MPFIVRSNLISFVLDLLFNLGLAFFCLFHFRIPAEAHSGALFLWASIYVPRTFVFFAYRIHKMYPIHRWLVNQEQASEAEIRAAARAAYESSLKTNIFYTAAFVVTYSVLTVLWCRDPALDVPRGGLLSGAFLSVAVGMGAFALGYPLNMVVTGKIANRLSLLMRSKGWRESSFHLPLRARVLILAVCLTGAPYCMMLSVHSLTASSSEDLGWLSLLCILLFLWSLLSAILFNLTISRPVNQVKAAVDEIFAGKSAQEIDRVPVTYPDELGVLAEGTNRMLDQLAASQEQIEGHVEELSQTNQSLQRATEVKGEFLASMSHELRTPLNAIIGFSKILLRKSKDALEERQYRNLELINKSGKQLLSLVNDILDFEKIEAGRLNIIPEEVDCEAFGETLRESLGQRVSEAGMELSVEVVGPPMVLWTDGDRLLQIVGNFVANAVKYAGEGTVAVRFERGEEEIQISVTDQGPGISEEEQSNVFESFLQLGEGNGGVGLGLAIVARLSALMGGRVDVSSAVGKGSTFSFYLPSSYELGELGLGRLEPVGEGADILVVDDQPAFLELMHGELSEVGYRVHLARSGEQALELLKELRPVAILLDLVMPGLDGWETLRGIRDYPETADVPVLVTSVLDEKVPEGLEHQIQGWLTKPVHGAGVQELLAELTPGNDD